MTGICTSFINFLSGLIGKIPDPADAIGSLPFVGFVQNILDFVFAANFILPIADIFIILSIVFVLRFGEIILFAINWIIKRIFDVIP